MRGARQARRARTALGERRPGSAPSSPSGRRGRCGGGGRRSLAPPAARSSAATASAGPETTQSAGPLTAASESSAAEQRRATSASGSGTASMAPAGSSCISRPRTATRARASSREKTPARQAATYSPMLWPSIACGRTPQAIHELGQGVLDDEQGRLREGRLLEPRAAASALLRRGKSSSRRSSPRCGREELAAAVDLAAEGRLGLVELARPCPAYCAPWPGTGRRPAGRGVLDRRSRTRSGSRRSERPRRRPRDPRQTQRRRRCGEGRAARPAGCRRRRRAAARGARRRCAASAVASAARGPSRVCAESSRSCQGRDGPDGLLAAAPPPG